MFLMEQRARMRAQQREGRRLMREFAALRFAGLHGYVVRYRNRFDKPHICRPLPR